jgi:hypothetical protein
MLWRLYGPTKVVTATLYPHADGVELRVYFEPEPARDILSSQVGVDVTQLEVRAGRLRDALREQGWVELGVVPSPAIASTPSTPRRVAQGAIWLGLVGVGAWMWSRWQKRAPGVNGATAVPDQDAPGEADTE